MIFFSRDVRLRFILPFCYFYFTFISFFTIPFAVNKYLIIFSMSYRNINKRMNHSFHGEIYLFKWLKNRCRKMQCYWISLNGSSILGGRPKNGRLLPWINYLQSNIYHLIFQKEYEGGPDRFIYWKLFFILTSIHLYIFFKYFFSRYGNPAMDFSDAAYKSFSKSFIQNFAPNILYTYLKQTDALMAGTTWMSSRVMHLVSTFFDDWFVFNIMISF